MHAFCLVQQRRAYSLGDDLPFYPQTARRPRMNAAVSRVRSLLATNFWSPGHGRESFGDGAKKGRGFCWSGAWTVRRLVVGVRTGDIHQEVRRAAEFCVDTECVDPEAAQSLNEPLHFVKRLYYLDTHVRTCR